MPLKYSIIWFKYLAFPSGVCFYNNYSHVQIHVPSVARLISKLQSYFRNGVLRFPGHLVYAVCYSLILMKIRPRKVIFVFKFQYFQLLSRPTSHHTVFLNFVGVLFFGKLK